MVPVSDPSDATPITESINGSWKLVIWKGTQEFMYKRDAGYLADTRFVRSIYKFNCDGVDFHESHITPNGMTYNSSCVMEKKHVSGRQKWKTHVRNNILESTLQIFLNKENGIYVHENRYIRKGRLHISSHFNVKTNGVMDNTECLRIFQRVPEEVPKVSEKISDDEWPELPVVAEKKETKKNPKTAKKAQEKPVAKEELPILHRAEEVENVPLEKKNPLTETPTRPSRDRRPIRDIPMVAEQMENPEDVEEAGSWEVAPIDKHTWVSAPLIGPPRPMEFSGDWKFSKVIGLTGFLNAVQIDNQLSLATADISITLMHTFFELLTKYSTTGGMEHETLEKLHERIYKNGTFKTVYFKGDSLISVTKNIWTGEEILKMKRSVEDGKLKTEYECMESKFTVLHEKV